MRRRLTVTGASDTIDGVSKLSVSEPEVVKLEPQVSCNCSQDAACLSVGRMYIYCFFPPSYYYFSQPRSAVRCAVTEYSGVSKKGHAPYNPRKKNQDALVMAADPATNTLVLCVLDGHGEHGDAVSASFREQLATEMFNHPAWATDLRKASGDSIAKIEHSIIRNFRIDTEFSGTTLSMAIIRGNTVTGVNIGDSRVILAKEEAGRLVPVEITFDHKPDSPAEKERIIACGGRVFAVEYDDGIDGPMRVWLGHMDVPGLAMSRCVKSKMLLLSWVKIV